MAGIYLKTLLLTLMACVYPLSKDGGISYYNQKARSILHKYGVDRKVNLFILPEDKKEAYASEPNQIHISTGFIDQTDPDELEFVLAHEYSHLLCHHMSKAEKMYNDIIEGHPIRLSGWEFFPWKAKLDERQADTMGQKIYLEHGGNLDLFFRPHAESHRYGSLNPCDTHFSFKDRWEYLRNLITPEP